MIDEFRNRTAKRETWLKLRARVRKHVSISSKQVLEKRMLLSNRYVVFMGGIVMKNPYQKTFSGQNPVFVSDGSNFLVYDFSGYFEVVIKKGCLDREGRRKMYSLKEGELIFIEGEVESFGEPIGYRINPIAIYSEDEMDFYRWMFPNKYKAYRHKMAEVKNSVFTECPAYLLPFSRFPSDIIRLFLNPFLSNLKHDDYSWLTGAIHKIYLKTKDVRLAQLILKYYLRETVIRQYCPEYEMERKERFFQLFPDLKGVVNWPDL